MARNKVFDVAEKMIEVQTSLASDRTPKRLKPALRRYLKVLQKSRDGRRDVVAVLRYPERSRGKGQRTRKGREGTKKSGGK